MKIPENLIWILIAIWLILQGLVQLLGGAEGALIAIMGLIALVAGVLLLLRYVRR